MKKYLFLFASFIFLLPSFVIAAEPFTVQTKKSTHALSPSSTLLYGVLTSNGEVFDRLERPNTTVGFDYGKTLSYGDRKTTSISQVDGETAMFSTQILNLSCGTTYNYRAFAIDPTGTYYSNNDTFSTAECRTITVPVVETLDADIISSQSAIIKGKILSRGNDYVGNDTQDFVVKKGSTTVPRSEGRVTFDSDQNVFTFNLKGLSCGIEYTYTATSKNSAGMGYGKAKSLKLPCRTDEKTAPVLAWKTKTIEKNVPGNFVTASTDGKMLTFTSMSYSGSGASNIYKSQDSGTSWVKLPKGQAKEWASIASSADGQILAGIGIPSGMTRNIYLSVDGGSTWKQVNYGKRGYPMNIDISADGQKIAVEDQIGLDYVSTDQGKTWTGRVNSSVQDNLSFFINGEQDPFTFLTFFANDTKLATVRSDGYVYVSSDIGATWVKQSNLGVNNWTGFTGSKDGKKLFASAGVYIKKLPSGAMEENPLQAYLYSSVDGGKTWVPNTGAPFVITSIHSSDDGEVLVATSERSVYLSVDGGKTWTQQKQATGAVALSGNGSVVVNAVRGAVSVASISRSGATAAMSDAKIEIQTAVKSEVPNQMVESAPNVPQTTLGEVTPETSAPEAQSVGTQKKTFVQTVRNFFGRIKFW